MGNYGDYDDHYDHCDDNYGDYDDHYDHCDDNYGQRPLPFREIRSRALQHLLCQRRIPVERPRRYLQMCVTAIEDDKEEHEGANYIVCGGYRESHANVRLSKRVYHQK